jgi:hypothetical protein
MVDQCFERYKSTFEIRYHVSEQRMYYYPYLTWVIGRDLTISLKQLVNKRGIIVIFANKRWRFTFFLYSFLADQAERNTMDRHPCLAKMNILSATPVLVRENFFPRVWHRLYLKVWNLFNNIPFSMNKSIVPGRIYVCTWIYSLEWIQPGFRPITRVNNLPPFVKFHYWSRLPLLIFIKRDTTISSEKLSHQLPMSKGMEVFYH